MKNQEAAARMAIVLDFEGLPVGKTITNTQALHVWVRLLQLRAAGEDEPVELVVRGYDADNCEAEEANWFTELDLEEDLPENLLDGTWRSPQIWVR